MDSAECSAEDCKRLVFEAVNENSVSKFQMVTFKHHNAEVLTSLAQFNEKGETPLEITMKEKNVSLTDKLMLFLEMSCISYKSEKTTEDVEKEKMSSIVINQLSNKIPIMELIDHLIEGFFNTTWLEFLAKVFIESTSFTRQDKIVALELIGASLLIVYDRDINSLPPSDVGLKCRRVAMTLRYFPAEGEPLLPKIPDTSVPSVASSVVFGSTVEAMTMEELDQIFWRAEQCQCLLVTRRTCNQANDGHPYSLYLKMLYHFGVHAIDGFDDWDYDYDIPDYLNRNRKTKINTFLLILEQMTCDPKLLPRKSFDIFIETLRRMSSCFIELLQIPGHQQNGEELCCVNLLAPTKFIGTISKFFPNSPMISSILIKSDFTGPFDFADLVFRFVFVLESISPRLSSREKHQLEEYYSNYIRNFFLERTTTVLHAAVRDRSCVLPNHNNSTNLMKLILKLGADPNAIDEKGRTPLHILAESERGRYSCDEYLALFRAMVDAGSHLDISTDNGETVLDILKRKLKNNDRDVTADAYFSSLINKVLPLSCYCARVIGQHGIRFDEDRLPLHLQAFITRHGAKDLRQHRNEQE